jgi:hypothetical protein
MLSAQGVRAMTTQTFNVNFSTANQSIWQEGTDFQFRDNRFLGGSWSTERQSLLSSDHPLKHLKITGKTEGKIGFQSNLRLSGGSISATLPIQLWIDIPKDVKSGETVTVQSGFQIKNQAVFSTISPAFKYGLDLKLQMNKSAQVRGEFPAPSFDK